MAKIEKKATTETAKKATPKKASAKKVQKDLGLIPRKQYAFVSNGKGPNMPKDKTFNVSGQVAQILFDKGYGEIKR